MKEDLRLPEAGKIMLMVFLILPIILTKEVHAQSRIVTGKVSTEEGETLPGVNVLVKGTTRGTVTDSNGNFNLDAVKGDVLVFSFIGYLSTEMTVDDRAVYEPVLQANVSQLGEVVVVGYGKQARELVSSAVSKIDPVLVESSPSINAMQALEGKVAGLSVQVNTGQPGEGATIFLRGGSSPNPNSGDAPLFIIDGVIRANLNGLNPDDIESLQVLKDAAATSIYGARAANGIILVTTKTGKGVSGSEITISYDYGVEDLRKNYPWTSAEEYIRVSRLAAQRGGNLPPNSRLEGEIYGYSAQVITQRGQYGFSRNTLTYLDDLIKVEGQAYVADLIDNQGFSTMKDPVTGKTLIFKDNNYDDVVFNPAHSHEIDVGMNGGNEMGNYYVGLGYADQEGIYIGTEGKNFSFLANGQYKVKDNFTIDAGATFQLDDWTSVSNPTNELNRSPKLPHTYRLINDDGTPALGESTSSPRNRLHELYYIDKDRNTYRMTYRFGADWEVIKGLSFKPSASYYRQEFIYSNFEKASREIPTRSMAREQKNENQFMANGLLNYTRAIENHNIDLLAGMNYTWESKDELVGTGSNAPTDLISTLNASQTEQERASSTRLDTKLLSYFGRVDYNYDAKYLFSASLRADGSSSFARNKKWGYFPAFSVGWNAHSESFWQNNPTFSKLKVRLSWGQAGNLATLLLEDTQGEFNTTTYHGKGGVVNNKLPNFDLTWETTTTLDLGFDMGFFNNRINLLVDLYDKVTSDRIISKALPAETGFNSIAQNYGELRNRGVEVELGATVLKLGEFTWRSDFNFAFNRTTIKKLPDNGKAKNRIDGGVIYRPMADDPAAEFEVGGLAEGERVGGIWAWDLIGVYADDAAAAEGAADKFKTQPNRGGDAIWRDVNGDHIIDEKDLVFVGWRYADKRGGMINTWSWKGISLRFAVDYALGHVIGNGSRNRSNGNGRNNEMMMTDVLSDDMWQQQGDMGKTIPRYDIFSDFDAGTRNHMRDLWSTSNKYLGSATETDNRGHASDNTLYYKKGDFLAFREVSLAYAIPKPVISKLGMSQATISIGGYNLGYLTAYDGLTPEIYDGADEGIYPRPRKFLVRLKATF